MAKRNSALDGAIFDAAKEEFLELGFEKASLHEIARKAGTTTGAVYTRYASKDDLFIDTLSGLLKEIQKCSEEGGNLYMRAEDTKSIDEIVDVIGREGEMYRNLLFKRYDECKMLICKSHGSKIEQLVEMSFQRKAEETAAYFSRLSGKKLDTDSFAIIIRSQFDQFRCILDMGWDMDRALEALKTVEIYQKAGWKALFETIV